MISGKKKTAGGDGRGEEEKAAWENSDVYIMSDLIDHLCRYSFFDWRKCALFFFFLSRLEDLFQVYINEVTKHRRGHVNAMADEPAAILEPVTEISFLFLVLLSPSSLFHSYILQRCKSHLRRIHTRFIHV